MRSDMAQVIVERPRFGSSMPSKKKGYRKQIQKSGVAELPRREPMPGRWRGMQRFLNEHLGPMRRFLRSNVGRPWNKVHQELCEHVSFDNAVQKHVLSHVFEFVEQQVEERRGRIVYSHGTRPGCTPPLGQMYVCPRTGLLKVVTKPPARTLPERIQTDPGRMHVLRDGAWWEVRVRDLPDDPENFWDVWLERKVSQMTKADCIRAYGREMFATSKRALSREETRKLLRQRRIESKRSKQRTSRWGHCPDQ